MAAIALLKFEQTTPSAIVGDGKALVVAPGNPVSVKNSTEGGGSNIASWRIELLYGVPGSPDEKDPGVPGLLSQNAASDTPLHIFTPNVGFYGCYRFKITVWDGAGYTGQSSVDIRNIAVATPNLTFILPPYQELPETLSLPEEDAVDGRENELNFEMPSTIGQPWGWSGDHDSTHRLWNEALLTMDGMLTSGGTLDWRDSVLSMNEDDPTGKDTEGNRYLIGGSPIGAWSGHAYELVEYTGGMWIFDPPNPGYAIFVEDIKKHYVYNGVNWVLFGTGAGLVGPSVGEEGQVCFSDNTPKQAYANGVKVLNIGGTEEGLELSTITSPSGTDLDIQVAGTPVLLLGSDIVTSMGGVIPGWVLSYSAGGEAEWALPSSGGVTGLYSGFPEDVGTSAVGASTEASPGNHVHGHGDQLGGTLHDDAIAGSPGTSGFISGVDQQKLDTYTTGTNYQLAYWNVGLLNYTSGINVLNPGGGAEDGLSLARIQGSIAGVDSLVLASVAGDDSYAVVIESNTVEVARFDNDASPRMALPAGGKISGDFGGTNEAVFIDVFDASTFDIGPKNASVVNVRWFSGNQTMLSLNSASGVMSCTGVTALAWSSIVTTSPWIGHGQTSAGAAVAHLTLEAQTSSVGDGADLKLLAGGSGPASVSGSVLLQVALDASTSHETVVEVDYSNGLVIHEPGGSDTISIKHDGNNALFETDDGSIYSKVPSGEWHLWQVTSFSGFQGDVVARVNVDDFDIYVPYLSLDSNGTTQGRIRFYEQNAPAGNSMSIQAAPAMGSDYVLMLPTTNGSSGQALVTDGSNPAQLSWFALAVGDVVGPAGGTADGNIAVYDDTTGKLLRNSTVNINGSNIMDGVSRFDFSGATTSGGDLNLPDNGSIYSYGSTAFRRVAEVSGTDLYLGSDSGATGLVVNTYIEAQTQVVLNQGGFPRLTVNATELSTENNIHLENWAQVRFYELDPGTNYVALRAPSSLGADYIYALPSSFGTSGQVLRTDGAGGLTWVNNPAGDVVGPASSTLNAIPKFNDLTGKLLANTALQIDSSDNLDMNGHNIDVAGGNIDNAAWFGSNDSHATTGAIRLGDTAGDGIWFRSGAVDRRGMYYDAGLIIGGSTTEGIDDIELQANDEILFRIGTPVATRAIMDDTGFQIRAGRELRLYEDGDVYYVGIQANDAQSSPSWTLTLPLDDGDSGQHLTTDGSGVCSWTDPFQGSLGAGILQLFAPELGEAIDQITNTEMRGGLIIPAADVTITTAHISVQQLDAGDTVQIGIYDEDGNRVGGVASPSIASVGYKSASFSGGDPSLSAGTVYYVMMTLSSATSDARFINRTTNIGYNEEPYGTTSGTVSTAGQAPSSTTLSSTPQTIPWIALSTA